MPKVVLEDARSIFKDGTFDPVQGILFLLRESPKLSAELLNYL
jgi:hypothetical protein